MHRRHFARIASASLLGGASFLTIAGVAHAQTVVFSSSPQLPAGPIETGREVALAGGTVQVKLTGGAIASFVDAAQFSIRPDGTVDLRSGSVTVVSNAAGQTSVQMPQGVRGTVLQNATGSFTANATGARGSATAGQVSITANGATKTFAAGQFWIAAAGRTPDRVIAGPAAAVPGTASADGIVHPLREGGVAAAAANGIPIALGEALAAAGAHGDVVAAARRIEAYDADPTIAAFPTGDYALLVGYAAQANGLLGAGGATFRGAGADIIRTYFEYLATGGAGANFRTAYAQVLLNYLDLLRAGVLPSTFRGATQVQLNAYLAFIGRTDGFGTLSAGNRQLLDAYLAFLGTGGTPDAFGTSVTNLTTSFLNYVRGGGNPASFTQASATVVAQYLAIVNSGGLRTNLTAQNQALLTAYLANNGVGFTATYATGLAAFVAYLNAGGLPSGYTALPAATIRSYLDTLDATGLFDSVLGTQAAFLRSYLVFLRGGGTADQFNALPINIARVNAANLTLYVDYLLAGGAPTAYSALTQAQIRAALDQLTATGQFNALLGQNAAFLAEYYAYIRTGADADTFAGLPSVDVTAYAASLQLFAAYLRAGNLPSGYTLLTAQQVRSYLTALQVGGRLSLLGDNAALLGDYLAYVRTGGAPDAFAGLPIVTYQAYAAALTAYFTYLNAGGLPSGYTALTQVQLRTYLDALQANGQFALLGANTNFYASYLTYLAGGGAADAFAGLPLVTYQGYAAALTAYFTYLNAGGLPSGYTALTQTQIRQYLDALSANAQLVALLGANATFFTSYRTYLLTGASVDAFAGLPIVTYQSYASALNAYYAFLIGGGTPSAYTALSQAQIRAYLDALKAAGQVTTLLGANAAFFTQYLAYLETGGAANGYPGLPSSTYGQYAAALNLYFAYLNAGGLPSGYTVLTQAQIRDYLSVLQANNQIAALLGTNATFFADYLTFVSGGGAADTFTGLPIVAYRTYATSLTAYYAYLAGGGLPANYTALTQAQIRQYLDALAAAGQITALLGQNAAFFTSYQVYLAGGGAPDAFTGLPSTTYAQYGTALQTFVAYLRGNGLPGSYAALTSAQIREYLAVLQANGQVALVGNAADQQLLTAYASYLASGGVPNQYQGLPAFATYETALRAYYAFLQGGGLPSTYTALTQAQIVAYFQALDAAGLAATRLSSAEATFLRSYTVYLAGGGNSDQFAGLPRNQATPAPVVTQGLANAPRGSAGTLGLASAGKGLKTAASTSGNVVLTGNGVTAFSGAGGATIQSAQTIEARTVDATIAIARVGNGTYNTDTTVTATANEGLHLVWGTPATAVPTTGTVNYGLVTATQPTVDGGAAAPGTFAGNLAVNLASRLVGWDSVIGIGGVTYRFASSGGTAAPSVLLVASSNTFSGAASTANNGLAGTGGGFLSGVGGIYSGFAYTATAPIGTVEGTAIFGKGQAIVTLPAVTYTGTAPAGLPAPNYAYVAGLPTARVNARTISQNGNFQESNIIPNVAVSLTGTGGLDRIGTGAGPQDFRRISAKVADVGGDARALVGRWYDGTFDQGTGTKTLAANQSLHYVLLAPATFTIPTAGRVDYTVLAATQPTFRSGITGPGLFDAKLAVLFGTAPRVAIEGTVKMPEPNGTVTYAFATAGGIAGAAALPTTTFSGYNFTVEAPVTGTGLACVSNCAFRMDASFAGADASRAGGYYYLTDGRNGNDTIIGAAAFQGTISGGGTAATGDLPAPTYAYASGLATGGLYVRSVYPAAAGTAVTIQAGATVTRDNSGALLTSSNASTQDLTRLTAKATDSFGDNRAVIGRWYDGTYRVGPGNAASGTLGANQSLHYVQLAPGSFFVPTSGQVNYTLLAATQPTYNTGAIGAGLFDGRMALAFGSSVKVALEGTIRMPETSGTVTYAFTTPGGVAGVAGLAGQTFSNNVIAVTAPITGSGLACTTQCQLNFTGGFGGSDVNRIGAVYFTSDARGTSAPSIEGAAIFTGTAAPAATLPAQPSYVYRGGFGTAANVLAYTEIDSPSYRKSNYAFEPDTAQVSVAADGGVASFTSTPTGTNQRGTARQADAAGDAAVLIGRWVGGTQTISGTSRTFGADDATHYVLLAPSAMRSLATGTVQYTLIAATQPTFNAGGSGAGVFDAKLGITFGATPLAGVEGAIYMPETAGTVKYSFSSTGGAAAPGAQIFGSLASQFSFSAPIVSGTGLACVSGSCTVNFNGGFGGNDSSRAGFLVTTGSVNAYPQIFAAAAFGAAGTIPTGTGGTTSTFTGSVSGQTTYAYSGGSLVDLGTNTVTYDTGRIKTYNSALTNKTVTAGVTQEGGRLADVIGWARWTGDTAGPVNNQGPNAGVHVMSGTPTVLSTLPTSGTAQYTLAASTKPTFAAPGTVTGAPGAITGSLAVAFGSIPRVGFDLTTTVGDYGWRVATTGGVANPGQSQATIDGQGTFSAQFNKNGGTVTATTSASCVSGCNVNVGGQLYGAGASHIGVAINVTDSGPAGSALASGIVIFAKAP